MEEETSATEVAPEQVPVEKPSKKAKVVVPEVQLPDVDLSPPAEVVQTPNGITTDLTHATKVTFDPATGTTIVDW